MTYRLLSRELGIHVDLAKSYLRQFQENTKESIHVTYILSGLEETEVTGPVTNSNIFENSNQSIILDSFRSLSIDKPKIHKQRVIRLVPQEKLEGEFYLTA